MNQKATSAEMERTIHRYRVAISDSPTSWPMAADASIVHVGYGPNTLPGHVDLWAEVPADLVTPETVRRFCVIGTGHPVPAGGRHVGSVHDEAHRLMWHVYEIEANGR
jgi:hypothetical protein